MRVRSGESMVPTAQHNRPEEQVALVYHPSLNRLGREICSAHRQIVVCTRPSGAESLQPSNSCSTVVLPLETDVRVFENTTLLAARQRLVKSTIQCGWSAMGAVSQWTIV